MAGFTALVWFENIEAFLTGAPQNVVAGPPETA